MVRWAVYRLNASDPSKRRVYRREKNIKTGFGQQSISTGFQDNGHGRF